MRRAKKNLPIYTLDFETDPFKYNRLPYPFAAGVYDDVSGFHCIWKPVRRDSRGRARRCWTACRDLIRETVAYLETLEPGVIYIHNGGRFDLFYLLDYMSDDLFILNNRIVKGRIGKHEVRDSYAIMPFPLRDFQKDDIDYKLMEASVRDDHRAHITQYLMGDCKYLWTLCSSFVNRFGPKLTIGSTALTELKKFHQYEALTPQQDKDIRESYYFGGRVECFEKGVIASPVKIFDVNSMYPFVMRDYKHPVGKPICDGNKITKDTFFVTVEGRNDGAFPKRIKEGSVSQTRYDIERGVFNVTVHEYEAAVILGKFEPERIIRTVDFGWSCTFAEFVNAYYFERKQAKAAGDSITALFTKYVLNSAYGKFAQNPENCFDYCIRPVSENLSGDGWRPSFIAEERFTIWEKPSAINEALRVNVATAASITGAARSVLMRALAGAERPIYCDTDSIICRDLSGVNIDESELGAWKLEKAGDRIAVAGRKMYAVFDGRECVKMASKGVRIDALEIERVARGEKIKFRNMVPTFKWDGSHRFIEREVRLT